jgi:transcriptional regulator of nitric oxide reductase
MVVFTLERDIFIGMGYFRTGVYDAVAFNQFQGMFSEDIT